MKLFEILPICNLIAEANVNYDTTLAKIKKEFGLIGYKKIGSGTDATVWAPKDGSDFVIKFVVSTDDGEIAEEVFNEFYEYCKSHKSNPHLPKFHEKNQVEIDGTNYLQIDMERLIPIKDPFIEAVVYHFSDYASDDLTWKEVCSNLGSEESADKSEETWQTYKTRNSDVSRIARISSKKMVARFIDEQDQHKKLYETMKKLFKIGMKKSFFWDLHTANLMQRPNGDIVIIDPWFGKVT